MNVSSRVASSPIGAGTYALEAALNGAELRRPNNHSDFCGAAVSPESIMKKRKRKPTAAADRIKALHVSLGMSLRDVHASSIALAKKRGSRKSVLPASRRHDYENKRRGSDICRLYTMSRTYSCKLRELLQLYDVLWLWMPTSS